MVTDVLSAEIVSCTCSALFGVHLIVGVNVVYMKFRTRRTGIAFFLQMTLIV